MADSSQRNKNSILFVGKFDEDSFLKLEKAVLENIQIDQRKKKTPIDYDPNMMPDVIEYEIPQCKDQAECTLWIFVGDVKPTTMLKQLISETQIILFAFNINNPDSLIFLIEGWGPIVKEAYKEASCDQKRFLVCANENIKSQQRLELKGLIEKAYDEFKCELYFEEGKTEKNGFFKFQIHLNLIDNLREQIKITNKNRSKEILDQKAHSILFIGSFDKTFLKIAEIVLNMQIDQKKEKKIHIDYDPEKDPNVLERPIPRTKYKLFAIVGDVKPNEIKQLISKTPIIFFAFNIKNKKSIDALKYDWLPIVKEAYKESVQDQKRLLVCDNFKNKYENERLELKNSIEEVYHELECQKYFETSILNKYEEFNGGLEFPVFPAILGYLKTQINIENVQGVRYSFNLQNKIANVIQSPSAKGDVIIPKSLNIDGVDFIVEQICDNAFNGRSLNSLSFVQDSSVKYIGKMALSSQTIKYIKIPASLESVSPDWILNSTSLSQVEVDRNNRFFYVDYNKYVIMKNPNFKGECLIFAPDQNMSFPHSVSAIFSFAFYNRKRINTFCIDSGNLETIYPQSFAECTNLSKFTIKNSASLTIEFQCFLNCKSLSNLYFINVKSLTIGGSAFYGCENLKDISISTTDKILLRDECFNESVNLKSISLISDQVELGNSCFKDCKKLESINFFKSSTTYYPYSNSYTNVTRASLKICIGEKCFENCKKLKYFQLIKVKDVKIGVRSFIGCESIIKVNIEASSSISMDDECFSHTNKLVSFVASCTNELKIGQKCFEQCSSLTSFTIPQSNIITIGQQAFSGCQNLKEISIIEDLQVYSQHYTSSYKGDFLFLGPVCFESCSSIEKFSCKNIDNIVIKDKIFSDCKKLKQVEIACNTLEIPSSFLSFIKGLKHVSLTFNKIQISEDSIDDKEASQIVNVECQENKTISSITFQGCKSLKSINFSYQESVRFNNGFGEFSDLTDVKITGSMITLNEACFFKTKNLQTVSLACHSNQNGQIEIKKACFAQCSQLNLISFENASIISFGSSLFNGCSNLRTIDISATQSIFLGKNCFENAEKLSKVNVKSKNLTIDNYCFKGCKNLESFKFTELNISCVTIGSYAFSECSKLYSISLTASTKIELKDNCFTGSEGLESVDLQSNEVSIGNYCFKQCKKLSKISFLNGIKDATIGLSAFSGCSSLTYISITVGNELNLNSYCFSEANSFNSVRLEGPNIHLGSNLFYRCTKLPSVTIRCPNLTGINDNPFPHGLKYNHFKNIYNVYKY